jgi:hypothetical protein
MSVEDLSNPSLPREKRLALALEFAISALNDAPSFRTHVERAGRPLSSYQLLPLLETVLRDDAPAEPQR